MHRKGLSTFTLLITTLLFSAFCFSESFNGARLIGRFDITEVEGKQQASATWPGSAIEFRFKGTSASLDINAPDRMRFLVEVDGEQRELWAEKGTHTYTLAENLKRGKHTIRVTRLAESFSGISSFVGAAVTDGKLLKAPKPAKTQLLFIGDSITAGYGVEGDSQSCSYSQDTSSPLLSYAGIATEKLNAEAHFIAWSGIGVWRSYGEETPKNPNITHRSQFTLGGDSKVAWDAQRFQPDAVIIAIGTNDYWQGTSPGYANGLSALLEQVQKDYASVPVFFTPSSMLNGEARADQVKVMQSLAGNNVEVLDIGRILPEDGLGCDWHPNLVTSKRMGAELAKHLKQRLQ